MGDPSLIRDSLGQSLDGMASTFDGILSAMKAEVPSAQSVIVEFLDKDGNVIVSKEFKYCSGRAMRIARPILS